MPVGSGGGVNSTEILYFPQFRSHQETKMAALRTRRSASTISRKNRGLRTVYHIAIECKWQDDVRS